MRARQLPQPSPEAVRRRLTALLDQTPDTAWDEVEELDDEPGPTATPPPRPGPVDPPRSDAIPGPWRRESVVVVGAIVLLGVVLSGLVLLRSAPVEVPATAREPAAISTPGVEIVPAASTTPAPAVPSVPAPATPAAPSASSRLAVHVIGEVKRPGLVELAPGARVNDAIAAADGLTARADPGDLNLAEPLQDGQQVRVGSAAAPGGEVRGPGGATTVGTAAAPGAPMGGAPAGPSEGPVNLNTASASRLEELPGVGPVTARKIVDWRDQHGGFTSVDQLLDVPGIGPKTYDEIAPRAAV